MLFSCAPTASGGADGYGGQLVAELRPSELTRQIKQASDIVAVVGSYLPLTPAGRTFKAVCPFHQDTRPSLQVSPEYQNFRCWACGKTGDVFSFVQEFEKVDFRQAREILARRAGIALEGETADNPKARLLDDVRWAAEQFAEHLRNAEQAADARRYLGERRLTRETILSWHLGFAPLEGDWLVRLAHREGRDIDRLVQVGVLGRRDQGGGCYDRFRDRVMFPIRDAQGRPVGFGGRILPTSPYASRGPKYYNSAETPLFSKSELIYGLDRARHAAADAGCLVVVEGYTDVLMAHQAGVDHVVATMGTALNGKHVQQLSRHTNRVVLVFDADAGGLTGVDRALELFVSQDVELAIATLPEGLDPCDLIVKDGPEPFLQAISAARDALDFKLEQVLAREAGNGIAGQKRAFDAVLGIMALAPQLPGQAGTIKQQLIVGRIARRLGLREETIWARLGELRDLRRLRDRHVSEEPARSAPSKAPEIERQLLEVLLAEPLLVARARTAIALDEVTHPEVRELLAGLYALDAAGEPADLDGLRLNLDARQATAALRLQEIGRQNPDRTLWFGQVLAAFHERRSVKKRQTLQTQLAATGDHEAAVALLRRLQDQSVGSDR